MAVDPESKRLAEGKPEPRGQEGPQAGDPTQGCGLRASGIHKGLKRRAGPSGQGVL